MYIYIYIYIYMCVCVCMYLCSVLQCVAVCSSMLQCVALCWNVLQCVAVWCHAYTGVEHMSRSRRRSEFKYLYLQISLAFPCRRLSDGDSIFSLTTCLEYCGLPWFFLESYRDSCDNLIEIFAFVVISSVMSSARGTYVYLVYICVSCVSHRVSHVCILCVSSHLCPVSKVLCIDTLFFAHEP